MSHFGRGTPSAAVLVIAAGLVACSKPPPGAESPEALGPADASVAPVIVESTASSSGPSATPTASAQAGPASDAPIVQTLFVREQAASCEAEGTRQCLMVRSSEAEDWRLFYADIEGFSYEPTFAYELRVAVSPVAGPAADAPSLRYALVEVVSKKKRP